MDSRTCPLCGWDRGLSEMREAVTGARPKCVRGAAVPGPPAVSEPRERLMNCVVGALLVVVVAALVVAQAHIP